MTSYFQDGGSSVGCSLARRTRVTTLIAACVCSLCVRSVTGYFVHVYAEVSWVFRIVHSLYVRPSGTVTQEQRLREFIPRIKVITHLMCCRLWTESDGNTIFRLTVTKRCKVKISQEVSKILIQRLVVSSIILSTITCHWNVQRINSLTSRCHLHAVV